MPKKKRKNNTPAQFNIFQGNELIREVIAEAWGYEPNQDDTTFTEDMYFSAFFYLCNRFGPPRNGEKGRNVGEWVFRVKRYTVSIQMNSCWVQVLMFGDGTKENPLARRNFRTYSFRSPYTVRTWREARRKKHLLVDLTDPSKEPENIAIQERLWNEFCQREGIDETWTNERFETEKLRVWMDYVENYNGEVIGINYAQFTEKYGYVYSNSQTSHALRTLRCFLRNLLTPIWIRDVGYNIKGRCGNEYDHLNENIPFGFVEPKPKRSPKKTHGTLQTSPLASL